VKVVNRFEAWLQSLFLPGFEVREGAIEETGRHSGRGCPWMNLGEDDAVGNSRRQSRRLNASGRQYYGNRTF
jgi:hypothetical protein